MRRVVHSLTLLGLVFVASSLSARELVVGDTGITFQAPDEFKVLSSEVMAAKWPSRRAPRWAVGNRTGGTTIAYDLKPHDISQASADQLIGVFSQLFSRVVPGIVWQQRRTLDIDGRQWVHLEFTSNAIDTDIHNSLLATSYGDQMLVFNFNSTREEIKQYQEALEASMMTISLPPAGL
ncbi:hypothetical protein [Marinobacter xestospongiae]|uniref:hypothetical protein n=1 Tax=Marinobacter xestospongiae TaxID=994319 RepID=UPI0020068087|nr:hypothetical protein [Marinobacter xestospongiae]MCK7565169.1 hypothetical protein [Marinobacter xestospongiae]